MRKNCHTIIYLCLLLFFMPALTDAQQYNSWYFGKYAGLDFNFTPPQPLLGGQINSYEACAVMGDNSGHLLFYSDGISLFNKNHGLMANGANLSGCQSSTNGVIIIPKPGSTHIYYVVTADCRESDYVKGYRYSEVDMQLDNGLGAVTALKNILLYSPSTERLAAVKAKNGNDYWIITKGYGNNTFTCYKVDCTGINAVPVVSNAGLVHTVTATGLSGIATLKASPDGKKIAVALTNETQNIVQLFDFNTATGIVSSPIDITGFASNSPALLYGLEFSPNSKMLYVSDKIQSTIKQFDLSVNNQAAINASMYVIGPLSKIPTALQLGPDSKIYNASPPDGSLNVINDPNVPGAGCNFAFSAVYLGGTFVTASLPTLISGFTDTSMADFTTAFTNCHVRFTGSSVFTGPVKWYWDFGDGQTDSGMVVNHGFPHPAIYQVILTVVPFTACGTPGDTIRVKKDITINTSLFAVNFGYTGSCAGQTYSFSDSAVLSAGNITGYSWDFGDASPVSHLQNPVHLYAVEGVYQVKLVVTTNGICGNDSISRNVYVDSKPVAIFSPMTGCIGQAVQFNEQSTNTTGGIGQWLWSFGDGDHATLQNPAHSFLTNGNYTSTLQVISLHGCRSDIIPHATIIDNKPTVDFVWRYPCLDKPTIFTKIAGNASGSLSGILWDFGDQATSTLPEPAHQFMAEGNYTVSLTLFTQNGCRTFTSKQVHVQKVNAFIVKDTFAVYDQPHQLTASGGSSFSWSPSTNLSDPSIANPVAKIKNNTLYTVEVLDNEGCTGYDKINLKVVTKLDIYVPVAFTPNGDGNNDLLKVLGFGIRELNYFKVYNRYGQLVFYSTDMTKGWDAKINGQLQETGSYVWIARATTIFGKVITKKGTTLLLH